MYSRIIVLSMIACLFVACQKNNAIISTTLLDTTDCMSNRKNQDKIVKQKGNIKLVSDQFIIFSLDQSERYYACNLPETMKKEGIKCTFSLIVKEIFPNERLTATPTLLTEIVITEQ